MLTLIPCFQTWTRSVAVNKDIKILHSLLGSNEAKGMDVGNDRGEMMNGTLIKCSYELKLLWSTLDVAGSRFVVKRPIKASLLLKGVVESNLNTVKPSHNVRGSINR